MLDEGICEPWTKIWPAPLSEGAISSFMLENGKMKKNEDTPGCKKKNWIGKQVIQRNVNL